MGGLLGQIHKQKRAAGAPTAKKPFYGGSLHTKHSLVLHGDEIEQVIKSAQPKVPNEAEHGDADELLLPQTKLPKADTLRVVLSSSEAQLREGRVIRAEASLNKGTGTKEDEPEWLHPDTLSNPHLEALVTSAEKILCDRAVPEASDREVAELVEEVVSDTAQELRSEIRLTPKTIAQAEKQLISLLCRKGPLQPLFNDSEVSEVFLDGFQNVRVIRKGALIEAPISFRNRAEYTLFLRMLLGRNEDAFTGQHSLEEFVLEDDWRTRVSLLDPSIGDEDEPRVCFRIPRVRKIAFYDVLQSKVLPRSLAAWLTEAVCSGEMNILVVGERGSGKTMMTAALTSAVSSCERVISIEDFPEIDVPAVHLEKMLVRPGRTTKEQLVSLALQRSPHRVVFGDVKPGETSYFVKMLEHGLSGSFASAYGTSCYDALWRLLDGFAVPGASSEQSLMRRLSRSVHLVVCMRRIEGRPCLYELAEVLEANEGDFVLKSLVRFKGLENEKRRWEILETSSRWIEVLESRGCVLSPGPALDLRER